MKQLFSSISSYFSTPASPSWDKGAIEDRFFDENIDMVWDLFYEPELEADKAVSFDGFGYFIATQQLGALMTHVNYRTQ